MNLQDWTHHTWKVLDRRPAHNIDRPYTHGEVMIVLEAALEALVAELEAGGSLRLHALGIFNVVDAPERSVISRFGGEERTHRLPARRRVRFSPSKRLTRLLNKATAPVMKNPRRLARNR